MSQLTALDGSDTVERLVAVAEQAMEVEAVRRLSPTPSSEGAVIGFQPVLEMRGRLRNAPDVAYSLVSEGFKSLGFTALFRRSPDGHLIQAVPGRLESRRVPEWIAVPLFLATLLSTLAIGAVWGSTAESGFDLMAGWPFAVSLLAILGTHEMGHYLVARRVGIPTTPPFFIPLPMLPFGTLGAAILVKAPPRNRRALVALGMAGPLAGLVVAVPVLVWGLTMSTVQPIPTDIPVFQEGNSLLYLGIKFLLFGRVLPSGGEDVFIHPVALAGWAGLLVTALNAIPAGQLDGGHVLYALIGKRAAVVTWGIIAVLLGLSILWPGWLIWVVLVYVFGRVHAVPLDDITELRWQERFLAVFLLLVAALVFVPIPFS